MTMLNIPLMRKTLEHIQSHPGEWNQSSWAVKYERTAQDQSLPSCGTTCCFAGWAVQLDGQKISWDHGAADSMYTTSGQEIRDAAQQALGLNDEQTALLFRGDNTLTDLENLTARYIAEAEST